jgi:hypothetical protein
VHQSCCPEKITGSFLSASDRQNRQEDSNLRSMTKLESSNPCVRSSSASTRRREMPQQKDPYPGRSPLQCHTITWNAFHQFSLPHAFNYSCDWSSVTGCPLESYIPGCYRRYMKHTMVARDAFDQNYPAETYKTTRKRLDAPINCRFLRPPLLLRSIDPLSFNRNVHFISRLPCSSCRSAAKVEGNRWSESRSALPTI